METKIKSSEGENVYSSRLNHNHEWAEGCDVGGGSHQNNVHYLEYKFVSQKHTKAKYDFQKLAVQMACARHWLYVLAISSKFCELVSSSLRPVNGWLYAITAKLPNESLTKTYKLTQRNNQKSKNNLVKDGKLNCKNGETCPGNTKNCTGDHVEFT